jgi:hypothetical protein
MNMYRHGKPNAITINNEVGSAMYHSTLSITAACSEPPPLSPVTTPLILRLSTGATVINASHSISHAHQTQAGSSD